MTQFHVVGKSVPRVDAVEKVTGGTRFCADLKLPGMLYGKLLRSPYPHARLRRVDTSKAEDLPGVKAVVTGEYAPTEGYRFFINERSILAREVVRFRGESVAAVAAVSPEIAEEAVALIKAEYEELPAVFDPEEALRPNPPAVVHPKITTYSMATLIGDQYKINPELPNVFIHRKIRHGNIEEGFRHADLVIENSFRAPRIHHGVLESQNVLARVECGGGFTAWITANRLHPWRTVLGRLFGIPPTQIRLISPLIGGSFGARNHPEILVAQTLLLAFKAGRPVKLVLNREECFIESLSRESIVIYIKDGVKKDGTLVAREMKLVVNGGAYNTATVPCTHNMPYTATGIYRLPHFKLDAYGVVTNEPPITAFSGYGTLQVSYAIEAQMDLIAERLGMDAVEIRRKNILNEGDEDPCGQTVDAIGIRGCLDKVADAIQWQKTVPLERGPWRRGKGIGLSTKHSAAGAPSVALVKVHGDATIEVRHGAHEQGAGCNTTMAQIAAEAFRTSPEKIKLIYMDTAVSPYDVGTFSSRSTHHVGMALLLACEDAKRQLFGLASARLGIPPDNLEINDGRIHPKEAAERGIEVTELFTPQGYLVSGGELIGRGVYRSPKGSEDMETGQGKQVVAGVGYGANAVEIAVNVETGEVKVLKAAGCFDMGRPINPKGCEGIMEQGLGFGIGNALFEEMVLRDGKVENPDFADYKLPSAMEMPSNEKVSSLISAAPPSDAPFGAKGFGEVPLGPLAAAIGNALYNAAGIRLWDIPLTKEKVLKALQAR